LKGLKRIAPDPQGPRRGSQGPTSPEQARGKSRRKAEAHTPIPFTKLKTKVKDGPRG